MTAKLMQKSKKKTDQPKKPKPPRRSFRLLGRAERPVLPPLVPVRRLVKESWRLLKQNWKLFGGLGLLYAVSYRVLVESFSRIDFGAAKSAVESSSTAGDRIVETLLLTGTAFDNVRTNSAESSFFGTALTIFFALAVIWAARQVMAGRTVRIRDALYNCATPLVPVLTLLLIIFLQLLPLSIGAFIYVAGTTTGVVQGGVESMVLFIVAALMALLSFYWLSVSLIGLMAVTLPGMYPLAGLRAAKELAANRRLQIFVRIFVAAILLVLLWLAIILLVISNGVTGLFLSEILVLLRAATVVLVSVMMYKLYRSLVDETTE